MNKIYNDVCKTADNTKNTGAVNQCLEAVTVMIYLLKQGFKFDSVDDFKSKTVWEQAIKDKNVIPLYEMYELTPNNTDAVFYESRNFRRETTKAVKITNWEAYLGFCSHEALASYEDSIYNRVVEVTEDGDLIGVYTPDGIGVYGQLLKEFNVGIRMAATTEKPAFSPVTMTYNDYKELERNAVLTTPDFNPTTSMPGIFDVNITQVGAGSPTLITFTAFVGCSNEYVPGLDEILELVDNAGVLQAGSSIADIGNGTYTATGATLTDGSISTSGVQSLPEYGDIMVEGSAPVTAS